MSDRAGKRQQIFTAPLSEGERLVREISAALVEAGVKAWLPKFPFGQHHDHYRTRFRIDGRHMRRRDVAERLRAWAATRPDAEDYILQAVSGALAKLVVDNPSWKDRIPQDVARRLDRVGRGGQFEAWLSENPPERP